MPRTIQSPLGKNCVLEVGGSVLWSVTDAFRRVVTDEIRATRRHGCVGRRIPVRRPRESDFTLTDALEIELVTAVALRRTSAITGCAVRPDGWAANEAVEPLQPRPQVTSVRVLLLPQGFSIGDDTIGPDDCLTNWAFQAVVFGPDVDEPLGSNAVARFSLSEWD